MKLRFQSFGELLDRPRLGQPRRPFDKHVAVGEQGDQQAFDEPFLAQDLCGQELPQRDYRFTVVHRFGSSWWAAGPDADASVAVIGCYRRSQRAARDAPLYCINPRLD